MVKFFVVDVFLTTIQYVVVAIAFCIMLEQDNRRSKIFAFTVIQGLVYIVLFYIFNMVMPYKSYVLLGCYYLVSLIVFRSKLIKVLFSVTLILISSTVDEVILSQIVYTLFGHLGVTLDDFNYMLVGKSLAVIMITLWSILWVFIWKLILKRINVRVLKEYLLFVLSQFALMNVSFYISFTSNKIGFAFTITTVALVLCMIADYFLFRSLKKANERYMLAQKNRVIEEQLNAQLSYYNQLKENINRNNKLNHDHLNQMQTIRALLDKEEMQLAKKQLSVLAEQTETGRAEKYCANEIVNAVIESKARICDEHGIKLNTEIKVPQEINIEGIHLCSVFANLLDNAIAACLRSGSGDCFINISAGTVAGSFIIKQENTNIRAGDASIDKSRDKIAAPYHGFGLEIIREIANQYKGDVELSPTVATFVTLVRLNL